MKCLLTKNISNKKEGNIRTIINEELIIDVYEDMFERVAELLDDRCYIIDDGNDTRGFRIEDAIDILDDNNDEDNEWKEELDFFSNYKEYTTIEEMSSE